MRIHIISETPFIMKGPGVHTAFVDHVNLLKEKNDVDVVINNEGEGDIMHGHTYGPYLFWKGRKYKGRRVYTVHVIPDSIKGSLPMWKFFFPFVRWYFKKVFSYADVCIAISPMVEKAIKELGVKSRIEKIANPIDAENWKRTEEKRTKGRKMLGVAEKDFVVLGVGQLQGRKGIDDFLEIAEKIPHAKFIWVGGRPSGVMTEGISRLNKKIAKASSHIRFTGLLDLNEMPYIYSAGDMLLFPSYQENCPLAPLEAAASGIPVIFRNLSEYNLLYEHPYLKANSTEEFTALTKKLMTDFSYYEEGQKMSEKLIIQFDKEKIREKLMALYSMLMNKYIILMSFVLLTASVNGQNQSDSSESNTAVYYLFQFVV